ncbi:topoisomerase DNA-binding C4 zinc finger domain-containing protein [Pseudomonas sp. SWRI124]|nr:topoisomerase DNA-binding C4 zinc finger domain-containing protein [Pseudomonas khavaziana]
MHILINYWSRDSHLFPLQRPEARDRREREAAQALLPPKSPASDWAQLGLCPLCGSNVVQRTARKGRYKGREFFGCSRYLRCLGIRKTTPVSP